MNKVNNKSSPIPNSIKNITNSSKMTNLSLPNTSSIKKNGNKIIKNNTRLKNRNNINRSVNNFSKIKNSNPVMKQTFKTLSIFCLLVCLVLLGVLIYINFYYYLSRLLLCKTYVKNSNLVILRFLNTNYLVL